MNELFNDLFHIAHATIKLMIWAILYILFFKIFIIYWIFEWLVSSVIKKNHDNLLK